MEGEGEDYGEEDMGMTTQQMEEENQLEEEDEYGSTFEKTVNANPYPMPI